MIRLLGAITGSALAIATLLVFVGVPQFRLPEPAADTDVMTLPLPTQPVDDTPAPATVAAAEAAPPESDADVAPPQVVAAGEIDAGSAATDDTAVPIEEPLPEVAAGEPGVPESWYAFWSPFRSELAASGFVEQLQRVTGLDYRVVRIKPGVYEVAFAYRDDDEIDTYLSQITAATGLEIPE